MVEVKVYTDIANSKEQIFMSMFGMNDTVFSADTAKNIFLANTNETDFRFNIHCDGGSVTEGLAIYDIIRTSGKNIHTNIDGSCHSMAIVLLLSAPFENRTANPNARALIHEVRGGSWDSLTADELRGLADEIQMEQNNILDIYAERTHHDRTELEVLMKEEKTLTASELLQYGFISKINSYSTNKNPQTMAKNQKDEVLNEATGFLAKLKNLLSPNQVINYDHLGADGSVLFQTEAEDDTIQIGMNAAPDGTFTLTDGRSVTISGGVITDIQEATNQNTQALENRIVELENALSEAQSVIVNQNNLITSNYKVQNRQTVTAKTQLQAVKTVEDLKNEAFEKRQKAKGGK